MNLEFQQLIPSNFHDESRVWIYQSSRPFRLSEALEIEPMLENFIAQWNTHGTPVKGYANLFFARFLVFIADESNAAVSGCSTDSSVRLVKEIEKKFDVDLFNRQLLAFFIKDKIETIPLSQLDYALEHGFINTDSPYFNNTVLTLKQLRENWISPVSTTWLAKQFPTAS